MKKYLSLLLAVTLIFCSSISVFADDAQAVHGLKKNTEIVETIANGGDLLVNGGVPYEDTSLAENVIVPFFVAGGVNHSHQYLTSRALTILGSDKGSKVSDYLNLYATTILSNSDWPDSYENDSGLFIGHFYNPKTGKTIFNMSSPTALQRFTTHANNAKKYYAKNKTRAMEELGRALHYLADINVPHHAALLTALNSNHTAFEKWVDETRLNYSSDTSGLYKIPGLPDPKKNFSGYCTGIFKQAANNALLSVDKATSSSVDDWAIAADASMRYAQEIMAAFLYNFLYSVGAVKTL